MSCMSGPNSEEKPRNHLHHHNMVSSGDQYCYSDMAASSSRNQNNILMSQLQSGFDPNQAEIYNVDNMIGFPSKNSLQQQQTDQNGNVSLWKELFGKPTGNHGGASSSKEISDDPTSSHHEFYQQQPNDHLISDHHAIHETLMDHHSSPSSAWNNHHQQRRSSFVMDDQSLRSCVFPCEGNERPSQGLSLSLSSSNPSTIGLQSFELRSQHHEDLRFGPSSSRSVNIQPSQVVGMNQLGHENDHVRGSNYLGPAQELLNEFCNLGTKESDDGPSSKRVVKNSAEWEDENSVKKQSLYSLDLLELQRRKTKLLQMLEEVDKRYKHYCDQMRAVKSSFESVAGNGAATVYSCLASKAMSRHFRCLRDGIMSQIKATKKAMGDKDIAAPGTVKGETPRLRLLDQTLRQQRALQQMSMMEIHPWRPQRGLPERSVSVLRAWLFEHFLHPYPSDVDKHILARQTGLSRSQVSNWFINARVRLWKPMVEEMYLEELKENEIAIGGPSNLEEAANDNNINQQNLNQDQKPTHEQLVRIDSECLSSIINNPEKNGVGKNKGVVHIEHHNPSSFGRVGDSYNAMELDFSSYTGHHHSTGGGNGVSLTLGLHQHGGNGGVSLAFSPASQGSLFYGRDHHHNMEGDHDVQTVQYSLLDSESQNLPYRNLMGAQLLHDLAG